MPPICVCIPCTVVTSALFEPSEFRLPCTLVDCAAVAADSAAVAELTDAVAELPCASMVLCAAAVEACAMVAALTWAVSVLEVPDTAVSVYAFAEASVLPDAVAMLAAVSPYTSDAHMHAHAYCQVSCSTN
jgi:Ca2+/Na+ antiporter